MGDAVGDNNAMDGHVGIDKQSNIGAAGVLGSAVADEERSANRIGAVALVVEIAERQLAEQAGKSVLGGLGVLGFDADVIGTNDRIGYEDGLDATAAEGFIGSGHDRRDEVGQARVEGDVQINVGLRTCGIAAEIILAGADWVRREFRRERSGKDSVGITVDIGNDVET